MKVERVSDNTIRVDGLSKEQASTLAAGIFAEFIDGEDPNVIALQDYVGGTGFLPVLEDPHIVADLIREQGLEDLFLLAEAIEDHIGLESA